MNKIEQHIIRQTETLESWAKASPQIKDRILSHSNRLATLEAAHSKTLKLIEQMQKRITALENPQQPQHHGLMQKIKGALT